MKNFIDIIIILTISSAILYIVYLYLYVPRLFKFKNNNSSWLDEHNMYRKNIGYSPVKWSDNLMKKAKIYAKSGIENLDNVSDISGKLLYKTNDGNLPMPNTTVSHWYKNPIQNSQMMRKDYKKIGCSIVKNVAVCFYDV